LDFAAAHFLPVISDEIYGELVFAGENFYPMANLNAQRARSWTSSSPTSAGPVPLITIGGLAKRWLVPGWRIGWILLHDPEHLFKFDMARALRDVCTVALAPSSITQAAVPDILRDTQREWYATAIAVVERSARACADALSDVAGLTVVRPRGSLYMLVGVDASSFEGIVDEWDFVQKLVWEEAVFPGWSFHSRPQIGLMDAAVPGRCFRYEGFMRIVTATKLEDLQEACVRLKAFCDRHRKRT
jgi:tyrosine aminotransferase